MTMQQLTSAQASPEVPVNENFATLAALATFGTRQPATTALTWGFYGGTWGGLTIPDGTLALTASTTNYVVVNRATGALSVSTSTTHWLDTATYARVAKLTTSTTAITSAEDHRAGLHGAHGQLAPPAAVVVASAATIAIPLGQRVVVISGTTGITSIAATGHSGAVVVLVFQGALTVTDGSNLKLASSMTTTADDTLTLACDGTNWYETARSVN